jgi:hypothetical protein
MLEFLKGYQTYIIIGLIVGFFTWHFLAVKDAINKNNAEWVQRIKDAPVKTDTITVTIYVPKPNTGGSGIGITHKDPAIDSLIAVCSNKDSLIQLFGSPKTMKDTIVADLGKLSIGYTPLSNLFYWSLTNRPPIPIKTVVVTNEKMVPVPFKTFGISGEVNGIGQISTGIKQRLNDFIIGINYQVAGPAVGTVWSEKLHLDVTYYIW